MNDKKFNVERDQRQKPRKKQRKAHQKLVGVLYMFNIKIV